MPRLKAIKLLRDRVSSWSEYPFSLKCVASLEAIEITSPVCFFVGENGTGKSTLLEAVAIHYGFGREGGSRNMSFETTESVRSVDRLAHALRVSFTNRTGQGYYLRAESFFNVASYIDNMGDMEIMEAYGGKSLHKQSHGESFISLMQRRFRKRGFYVMDEPEAALSPQRQLSALALWHEMLRANNDVQFLIATHSPILLAYPGAQILSFDGGEIHEIKYRESQPFQLVSRFVAAPERYINALLHERGDLGEE